MVEFKEVADGQTPPSAAAAAPAVAASPRHSVTVHFKAPRAAICAMYLWAAEYHASGLGMVDWFASLDPARKLFAERVVSAILDASP